MDIDVRCTQCNKTFRAAMRLANQVVICPNCNADVVVPRVFLKRKLKCACMSMVEVPIEDANFEVICPKCSRSRPPIGLDTFLDHSSPHYVPQKGSGGLLRLGKVVASSKAEAHAQQVEEDAARRKKEEDETQQAQETVIQQEAKAREPETASLNPGIWSVLKIQLLQFGRWSIASWSHFAIVVHGFLIPLLFAVVVVRHLVLVSWHGAASYDKLYSGLYGRELAICFYLIPVLIVFALIWAVVLSFLSKAFQNKALAESSRQRRHNYPHLKTFLTLAETVALVFLCVGLVGSFLSEIGGIISAFAMSYIPVMGYGPAGILVSTAIGIFVVVFIYVAMVAGIELIFMVMDIEQHTGETHELLAQGRKGGRQKDTQPTQQP